MIKPVEKYIRSGKEEIQMLERMNKADNATYSPKFVEKFEYLNHLVIITTLHGPSLYKTIKDFSPTGFPLPIVRMIAKNILEGLDCMHVKAKLAHTDLKVGE